MAIHTAPISLEEAARSGECLSYAQYLETPITHRRYEIVEGKVSLSPSATVEHQWLVGDLYELLKQFVKEQALGVVLTAPLDVIIRRTPKLRTRQPDILFLNTERSGARGRNLLRRKPRIDVTPDLVVEVLSPEDTPAILGGKLADFAEIGVPEVWLVSPTVKSMEVLQLAEGRYHRSGLYGAGSALLSPVLPGFTLEIDTFFAEEDTEEFDTKEFDTDEASLQIEVEREEVE